MSSPTTTPWNQGYGASSAGSGVPAGSYADGAPLGGWGDSWTDSDRAGSPEENVAGPGRANRVASRIRSFEGPRGYSVRMSVAMRHLFYLFVILTCAAATNWAFSTNPTWRFGGHIMLFSACFMLVVAAVGTLLYADQRNDIAERCRHFVFGVVCLPGTAIAMFMRLINSTMSAPSADGDMFVAVLKGNGMPLIYIATVVIPSFVFAKYVFGGIRTMNRSSMTDEESMHTYMRLGPFSR